MSPTPIRHRGRCVTIGAVAALVAPRQYGRRPARPWRARIRARPWSRHHWRCRSRRDAGGHAQRDPSLRRSGSCPPCARMASEERLISRWRSCPGLADHGCVRPDHSGGVSAASASPKEAMCVVTEELSRGYIGVGLPRHPVGDRGGTDPGRRHGGAEGALSAQARFRRDPAHGGVHRAQHRLGPRLPAHPRGEGRARAKAAVYKVSGNKTWITHPVRADLMTLHGPHRSQPSRAIKRPVPAAGGKAARHRCQIRSRRRA